MEHTSPPHERGEGALPWMQRRRRRRGQAQPLQYFRRVVAVSAATTTDKGAASAMESAAEQQRKKKSRRRKKKRIRNQLLMVKAKMNMEEGILITMANNSPLLPIESNNYRREAALLLADDSGAVEVSNNVATSSPLLPIKSSAAAARGRRPWPWLTITDKLLTSSSPATPQPINCKRKPSWIAIAKRPYDCRRRTGSSAPPPQQQKKNWNNYWKKTKNEEELEEDATRNVDTCNEQRRQQHNVGDADVRHRHNRAPPLMTMTISMMKRDDPLYSSSNITHRCLIHNSNHDRTFLCSSHHEQQQQCGGASTAAASTATTRIMPSNSAASVLVDNIRARCKQCKYNWPSLDVEIQLCDVVDCDHHGGHNVNVDGGGDGHRGRSSRRQAMATSRSGHGGRSSMIPAVLLMLHEDFIVTSPLKQNLLLTLALTRREKNPAAATSDDGHGHGSNSRSNRSNPLKQQSLVLVGKFKAFASFFHLLRMLGPDAMRVRTESNAGGTSTISESLSVEYFVRRFNAKEIVTEMEVEYCSMNWKKVDYVCTLYGQRVGVSVTRAMSFPDPAAFTSHMACRLLYKKLFGLVVARHGVSKRHGFSRCILHVWCETQRTAGIMLREYDGVSRELDIADDVIMVLTVAEGWHAKPIFYESVLRTPKDYI